MKNIYVERIERRHDINRAVIATMKFSEKYTLILFEQSIQLDLLGLIKSLLAVKSIDNVA
jgi:hypothetical protein